MHHSQQLFSYGTLRDEAVQLSTFGRTLEGQTDTLIGFSLAMLEIEDPKVIATSGKSHHPILTYTGKQQDKVEGVVFSISELELNQADTYEVKEYKRVLVSLNSGMDAWVYINAQSELSLHEFYDKK